MASLIPHARFVELPGDDHLPFVGDQEALLDQIERFLSETRTRTESDQVLATILCTRPAPSSLVRSGAAVADRVSALVASTTRQYSGRGAERVGDDLFASFDGPARAIRCGCAIVAEGARAGLPLRAGLHTGECDVIRGAGQGLVAQIAARVAALARPGDVLVSRTLVDLVAGSGLQFCDRGMHALADGEKPRRLFAVQVDT
jgi:class 3 adenylate cyclase